MRSPHAGSQEPCTLNPHVVNSLCMSSLGDSGNPELPKPPNRLALVPVAPLASWPPSSRSTQADSSSVWEFRRLGSSSTLATPPSCVRIAPSSPGSHKRSPLRSVHAYSVYWVEVLGFTASARSTPGLK